MRPGAAEGGGTGDGTGDGPLAAGVFCHGRGARCPVSAGSEREKLGTESLGAAGVAFGVVCSPASPLGATMMGDASLGASERRLSGGGGGGMAVRSRSVLLLVAARDREVAAAAVVSIAVEMPFCFPGPSSALPPLRNLAGSSSSSGGVMSGGARGGGSCSSGRTMARILGSHEDGVQQKKTTEATTRVSPRRAIGLEERRGEERSNKVLSLHGEVLYRFLRACSPARSRSQVNVACAVVGEGQWPRYSVSLPSSEMSFTVARVFGVCPV